MTDIRDVLSKNIKENRHKLGLTQSELAERANISTNFLAMIELKHKFPTPEVMKRLAKAMDIETYELFNTTASPENVLKNLHEAILRDLDRAVQEAVDKAINKKLNELKV